MNSSSEKKTIKTDRYELYCGDALEVMATLERSSISAVVTDPPFGMDWDTDSRRFTGGQGSHHKNTRRIANDEGPFDPSPWLEFPRACLWGSNHFAQRLPKGTTLVWAKKGPGKWGKFLSDGEIGWMKGGEGVYLFHHTWDGCARESEHGEHLHPSQKPIALWLWVLGRMNLAPNSLVFDPYMGSASVGKACLILGHRYIGCDIDEGHFETAVRQMNFWSAQGNLFA